MLHSVYFFCEQNQQENPFFPGMGCSFPRKKLLQTPHSTWQSSSTLPGVFDLHPGMSFQSFLQYPQLLAP